MIILKESLYRLKRIIIKLYTKYFTVEFPETYVLSDKSFIKKLYKKRMGKEINLSAPKTFTEKQNWLKLYDRRPVYTVMVDKFLVRDFVAERIGEEYLVPLLGVWNNADEIDFESLPDKYVLKCNHNSDVIICKDKVFTSKAGLTLTKNETREKLNAQLKLNYYKKKREWPYKNVSRKIICEKYMENQNLEQPLEYKVFCFNGKPEYILVIGNRFSDSEMTMDTYDFNWVYTDLINGSVARAGDVYKKPKCLEEIYRISVQLSENVPFVRVDFNFWNDKIYFGELTFSDAAGFEKYKPEKWDYILGERLSLPKKYRR